MNVTEIYDLYQKGVDHHQRLNMYRECEKFHNFYSGNQWEGLKSGDEELPIINIIKPIGKYKIAMIAQNQMSIVYNAMNSKDPKLAEICKKLSRFAMAQWEKSKMDMLSWRVIKNAYITGDHYLYGFDERTPSQDSVVQDLRPRIKMRLVNKTNIYFADEQNPNIDEQEYIIISERIPVKKVIEIAKKNNIPKEQIDLITSDEETETQIGESKDKEVQSKLGKCTSLLFMRKTEAGIEFCRATKYVIYVPKQLIPGLDVYPVVGMRWEEKIGSARGESGVKQLIPNQLEINRTAARRAIVAKRFAFPALVYDEQKVTDPDALNTAGAVVAVKGAVQNLDTAVKYLNPASMSTDAEKLQAELIQLTRELEGAGDAATGQVDPTKASGESIKAARDAAAVPLNEQIAAYKQFVEDVALMWYKMWVAYSPNGLEITYTDNGQQISEVIQAEVLKGLDIDIKIDVSPIDPYSKLSRDISLERLFVRGSITFEEYVEALSEDSSVPKATLEAILKERQSDVPPVVIEALKANPVLLQFVISQIQQQGGDAGEMPKLPNRDVFGPRQ